MRSSNNKCCQMVFNAFSSPMFSSHPYSPCPMQTKGMLGKMERQHNNHWVIIEFSDADESEGGKEFKQLTGDSWNPDLLTTGAIPSICGGLYFNNVVLFDRQQKFSWSFICVQYLHIILTASPIENLENINKHTFYTVSFYFLSKIYCSKMTLCLYNPGI